MKEISKKIIISYSIFLGVSVMLMWFFILINGQIEEGRTEMIFHLFSESLMAILCIAGGISFLKRKNKLLLIAAHAMVVYSVINAAGFYLEKGEISMGIMFGLFLICSALVTFTLIRNVISGNC